jgi:hypothetical protein
MYIHIQIYVFMYVCLKQIQTRSSARFGDKFMLKIIVHIGQHCCETRVPFALIAGCRAAFSWVQFFEICLFSNAS